jgi:hypothetical protein
VTDSLTSGLPVRFPKNTNLQETGTCEVTRTQLTPDSRKDKEIDTQNIPDDLAEIVAIWPQLPEVIRSAIMAIVICRKS